MKKSVSLLLALAILLSCSCILAGCNEKAPEKTQNTEVITEVTSAVKVKVTTEAGSEVKSEASSPISETETTVQDDIDPPPPEPPPTLSFSSFDELSEFAASIDTSSDAYLQFASLGVALEDAQRATENLLSLPLPNAACDEFGGTYSFYHDGDALDLVFKIGQTRYRFVYYFNGAIEENTDAPALADIPIGSRTMDMHRYEDRYVGILKEGSVSVIIGVYTDEKTVSFDAFEFIALSDLPS